MAFDLWGRFKKFMSSILIPKSAIENGFQVETIMTSEMERALTRWYNMYIDSPEWATDECRPLGLPKAIAKEFAQVVFSELSVTFDGGPRAEYLQAQIERFLANAHTGLELGIALGGLALKPYVSGKDIFIDATGATGFTPLRFDDGGICVSGVFRSNPIKYDRRYFVKLEYHDFRDGLYTIRNKVFSSDSKGVCSTEVSLDTVPDWADLAPEVTIQNVERPLFGYFTPPAYNNVDASSDIGLSIYAGATEDLIQQADDQWAQFRYEFKSSERKIIATAEAVGGVLPGGKPNPLATDRLFVAMPYDSAEFFHEFSPDLRHTGFYDGLQAILRRIEFNVGLAYGDLSDPTTVEKTATEVVSAKNRKYNTVRGLETRFKEALESAIYGANVYATLFKLAPQGEYEAYIDFDDSVLTDNDALRERDRQDVRDGLMQKYEYRMKWYNEDEETAKAMVAEMATATPDPFGFG